MLREKKITKENSQMITFSLKSIHAYLCIDKNDEC